MAKKKPSIATPTTTDGFNGRNGHVSLARVEYDALIGREETISMVTAENAKLTNRTFDLAQTLDVQAKHLTNFELKVMHLERINALQGVYIDLLKDKDKVLGVQELSEFWKQWIVHTSNAVDNRKVAREEVAKVEPDLFRSWRNWVNDYGKADRSFSLSGTRAERDANQPQTQAMMQTHIIARQREELAKLAAKVQQLEAEVEQHKKSTEKPAEAKP
jgi:hypothetical protein